MCEGIVGDFCSTQTSHYEAIFLGAIETSLGGGLGGRGPRLSSLFLGGFMARGAEDQLRLVVDPGVPTLRDESVGRWDGRKRFFPEGFNVGGHL